ncbi:MAG TPA: amidohydrolase family protein [Sphingomonadaceae bacterium]|nr:amidohydrolase family protein [Sphingomonadaceae bacterium]
MAIQDDTAEGPLIDCHAHVWGPGMPFVSTAWVRPDYVYSAEDLLADLDAHGVRYGVIAAASLFGTYNDYSIRALRAHKRLRATANVDPTVDFHTLEAMRADGIVGVRLQWFGLDPLPDIGGDDFQRLCCRLRDLGMHIHLNIEGDRLVEVASRLIDTGVRLVIDHFGWHDPAPRLAAPSYQGMVRLLDRGNVWVKMTSAFRHPDAKCPDRDLPAEYARDLLRRFGPEKLFWGSDAPFIRHEDVASYGMAIDMLNHIVPDAATRRAIGENGYRFYFGD